jgi:hypothetical protein
MSKKEEQMIWARMEASRAWCGNKTSKTIMDPDIAEEFAGILVGHMFKNEEKTEIIDIRKVINPILELEIS